MRLAFASLSSATASFDAHWSREDRVILVFSINEVLVFDVAVQSPLISA